MAGTYEKNGIVYFEEPYSIDYSDWAFQHLDCDSIVERQDTYSDTLKVICYAKSSEFNGRLMNLWRTEYANEKLFRGMGASEVNSID